MHVRKAVDQMRAGGLSPKSIRTYVGTLVAIMNAAVDADLIPRSPVRGFTSNRLSDEPDPRSRPSSSTSLLARSRRGSVS
jgi:hypothetical protein